MTRDVPESLAEEQDRRRAFAWYSAGVGTWFGAWGMQQVLFSWIVVGELEASSEWVGIAQTSTMLPSLVFLLAGGVVADRVDPRRMLIVLHLAAAVPALALAVGSALGVLGMPGLLAYGVCIGTLQAFVMPARDTLLSRVAGRDMMRAVTTMTAAQFGAQAMGTLLAGAARWTGSATMLFVQSIVVASGSAFSRGIPPAAPREDGGARDFDVRDLADGLRQVRHTPRLRVPVSMVVSVGVLFVGPFVVVFPLLVRDYYQGGVDSLSLILMLFPVGTIVGSVLLRRRGIARKGRAALIALAAGALAQIGIGTGVPFWAMVILTFLWGLAGSVFINCSRTLYQEAAPMKQRGRVMAVYQLGFIGGAPIGAMLSGYLSSAIGLHGTLIAASVTMGIIVLGIASFSSAWRMD
jgi:MFS family permease